MSGPFAATVFPLQRLGRLAEIQLGKMLQPAPSAGTDREVPYMRAGHLTAVPEGGLPTMWASTVEARQYRVQAGDLLVAEGGDVGRPEFAPPATDGAIIQNSLHRLRVSERGDIRFLRYALLAVYFSDWLDVFCNRSTFGHLTVEKLSALQVPVPPQMQQAEIADFLDTETARIDALITKKGRMIELLEERFLERARQAVTQGHYFPDPLSVTAKDVRPPAVEPVKLSWVAEFGSGTTPQSGNRDYYDGPLPWVLTGDLNDGDLAATTRTITEQALLDYSALKLHDPGDLVVAMYGATIGKMSVLQIRAAVNQACCVIKPGSEITPLFLFFYLLGFRTQLVERGRGSGQPNISQEALRALRLPIPHPDVQCDVVERLVGERSRTRSAVTRLRRQLVLLQEHRQALITAAVTGGLQMPGVAA